MSTEDNELRLYLQRVVGNHGKVEFTSVRRFDTWHELPWDDEIEGELKTDVLPPGPCLLIGMRDTILQRPGPEGFIALPGNVEDIEIATQLAAKIITLRRNVSL